MSCATTIYTNLDTVMIGFIKGAGENGYYNAAIRIKSILVSIVTSLGAVLLPRASYYLENNLVDEFKKISAKAINFVFIIAIPMLVYFMLFANESIHFLAGDAFDNSILPMQIIMPTLLFIGLTNIMGIQMLVPLGREKCVLYSEIAGAITDLVLNAILIPFIGTSGAAIGTVAAEAVVMGVQYICLKDEVKPIFAEIHYGLIAIATILSTGVALLTKMLSWHPFFILVVSAIIFFGIYALVLTVGREPLVLELEDKFLGRFLKKWKTKKRLDWIDMCRGIVMILVVLGHTLTYNSNLRFIIFTFHMPVLFVISGFVFKLRLLKTSVPKYVKRLLMPMYLAGVALLIYRIIRMTLEKQALADIVYWIKRTIVAVVFASGVDKPKGFPWVHAFGMLWFWQQCFGR